MQQAPIYNKLAADGEPATHAVSRQAQKDTLAQSVCFSHDQKRLDQHG